MLIGAAIWIAIGACFGWFRARARYRSEYRYLVRRYADEKKISEIKRIALLHAALEFLKWSILGILSGISFLAWVLLVIALTAEKEVKKTGVLEATIFSAIVFILGAIALDKVRKNFVSGKPNILYSARILRETTESTGHMKKKTDAMRLPRQNY